MFSNFEENFFLVFESGTQLAESGSMYTTDVYGADGIDCKTMIQMASERTF